MKQELYDHVPLVEHNYSLVMAISGKPRNTAIFLFNRDNVCQNILYCYQHMNSQNESGMVFLKQRNKKAHLRWHQVCLFLRKYIFNHDIFLFILYPFAT